MRISGWQAALWLIVALVAFAVLAVALFWLALIVAALGAVMWLHLVVLPRVARRLHVRRIVLDALVLLALLGGGWLLGAGPRGATIGGLIWLLGVGVPRLVGAQVRRRLRTMRFEVRSAETRPSNIPLRGRTCVACGTVSFGEDRCPSCGAHLEAERLGPA